MSDVIDDGSDREQFYRELCIARVRQQASEPALLPMGICYNCQSPVDLGERYCPGPDCRDDHQKRMAAEIRRGRIQ